MLSWFELQLKAIGTLWDAELPEAVLTIIYSGIDSFGLLAAPAAVLDASGNTFKQWCETYILTRLQSLDGTPVTSVDLWAARCGVLHTSTPLSKLERDGNARQIFYQFKDKTGINMMLSAQHMPVRIDISALGLAFKEGGIAFLTDLKNDPPRQKLAEDRAQNFLRWATAVP
jgi:hypothetical protein